MLLGWVTLTHAVLSTRYWESKLRKIILWRKGSEGIFNLSNMVRCRNFRKSCPDSYHNTVLVSIFMKSFLELRIPLCKYKYHGCLCWCVAGSVLSCIVVCSIYVLSFSTSPASAALTGLQIEDLLAAIGNLCTLWTECGDFKTYFATKLSRESELCCSSRGELRWFLQQKLGTSVGRSLARRKNFNYIQ